MELPRHLPWHHITLPGYQKSLAHPVARENTASTNSPLLELLLLFMW